MHAKLWHSNSVLEGENLQRTDLPTRLNRLLFTFPTHLKAFVLLSKSQSPTADESSKPPEPSRQLNWIRLKCVANTYLGLFRAASHAAQCWKSTSAAVASSDHCQMAVMRLSQ
jgi:hypothetical protein